MLIPPRAMVNDMQVVTMTRKVAYALAGLWLAAGWAVPTAAAGGVKVGSTDAVRTFETLGPVSEFELLGPRTRSNCCRP